MGKPVPCANAWCRSDGPWRAGPPISQYDSIHDTGRLAQAAIEPSVGSVDNALAESIKAVSTRPNSSTGAGAGGRTGSWNSPSSSEWTGSTVEGCWNPPATSRVPRPKHSTSQLMTRSPGEPAPGGAPQPISVRQNGGGSVMPAIGR